ncbi:Murein DD-endopeptidase MepM and murein hydrolase activator NlpD, contain LysM domain [Aureimonas jatrophae]|uniref:Murein DD-endopeptidase MepM and murein hydrolase activator NlpD, contain LysM domain n=2 Tax=Aureimonas jatrophae TaxID=1166073 RepID=A0A1H0MUC8_9HYPH|nr:Murein DD-endopeptidase MepM and murein hydrolase activator NlpD, contain LysM domain [Aureimonas jatrophae]
MRADKVRITRLRLVRSAALVTVAALAGCSADATRLQDGFYTGAIPKASVPNQVAAAPVAQPNASMGMGTTGTSQTYAAATPPVTRSSLPPPPAASYNGGGSTYAPMAPSAAPTSNAPIASREIGQTQAAQAMDSPSRGATGAGGMWTVTSGDSVLGIARRAGVRAADLRAANNLSDDNIRIGQVLRLPNGASGQATAANSAPAANTRVASLGAPPTTLQAQAAAIAVPRSAPVRSAAAPAAAATTPVPVANTPHKTAKTETPVSKPTEPAPAMAAAPAAAAPVAATSVASAPAAPATTVEKEETREVASLAPASTGIDQFRWPVQGRVVKNFGDKVGSRRNEGLNISVPRGTPVKAAENGVVIYAGDGLKEFGKTVLVKHDNGLVTVYGHADDILVQRGATVKRGQEIAKAGMTGDTETPMLHFEVRKDSSPVNPMTYLQ